MKTEILKSAKGNDQKQINRPNPKTPNPQNPGRLTCQKKQTQRKGKLPKCWRTNPAKHETAPEFYLFLPSHIEI